MSEYRGRRGEDLALNHFINSIVVEQEVVMSTTVMAMMMMLKGSKVTKITNEQRLGIVYPAWWRGALLYGWQNGQGGFTSGGTIIPIIFSWFFMLEIMLISANAKLNQIPVKPVPLKGASNWLQIQERSRSSSPSSSAPSSWCSSSFWSDGVHCWLCLGATADEQHQERIIQPGYHCRQAFSQVYMHQNSGAFYNPNMLYYKSRPTL